MKVVFLDYDGVLNSDPYLDSIREVYWAAVSKGGGIRDDADRLMLDPERIELLNGLLERSGAMVVFSTSWRNLYSDEELIDFLVSRGFKHPERIVGRTPTTRPVNRHRGELIQMWLNDHPEVKTYVAIDDDPGAGEAGTVWLETDPMVGLTSEIVDRAVGILDAN